MRTYFIYYCNRLHILIIFFQLLCITCILQANDKTEKERADLYKKLSIADSDTAKINVWLAMVKHYHTYKFEEWKRVYAKINETEHPTHAVNEFLYTGNEFRIIYDGRELDFRANSGLIVSSATGSTAQWSNCGGTPFGHDLNTIGYLVREADRKRPTEFPSQILKSNTELLVYPYRSGFELKADAESLREINAGDELRFGLSDKDPVKVVVFEGIKNRYRR